MPSPTEICWIQEELNNVVPGLNEPFGLEIRYMWVRMLILLHSSFMTMAKSINLSISSSVK